MAMGRMITKYLNTHFFNAVSVLTLSIMSELALALPKVWLGLTQHNLF